MLTTERDGFSNEKIELTTKLAAAEAEVTTLESENVDMLAKLAK